MTSTESEQKSNFNGKWKLDRQDNLDGFLSANGVNWMVRKMANLSSPELEVSHDGDKFVIITKSAMMTKEWKVTIGEEIEDTQKDGAVFKLMPKFEDGKLIFEMTPKVEGTGKPQTHTRYIENDEFILEMEVGDVKTKRIFKRIQ